MSFFDYLQLASVAIFLMIVAGRATYLWLSRGIRAIVIGSGKTGWVRAVELLTFTALVIWIAEIVLYASHASFHIFPAPLDTVLLDSLVAKVAGAFLITVGLIIFILAFLSFGDSWRVGFDVKTPGQLVTTGMFAVSRNPIYVFIDLWAFGVFLINGTLIFLLFALLTLIAVHWQILQEEIFLTQLYGKPYADYCKRTGRYLLW